MATRAELMQRLSTLPTEELLHLLRDETIFEIAARYFSSADFNTDTFQSEPAQQTSVPSEAVLPVHESLGKPIGVPEKAKRPLNAFMAFRSYYLKLFPDVQQKIASGFLTTLWNKDLARNKWALIAKVYSFVRDEIGKNKVSLSYFLSLSCPIMNIAEPSTYLSDFGWVVKGDENGGLLLLQDGPKKKLDHIVEQPGDFPSTEFELLSAVISVGYLPDQSFDLMQRMSTSNNGIMTTMAESSLPVPYTKQKLDFINTIQIDPLQASRDLLGSEFDDYTIQFLGVNSHNVEDLSSISHIPMQLAYPDPRRYYSYSTNHTLLSQDGGPIISFDDLPDYDSFDIDSPWDIDAILGQTEQEGQRTAGLPAGPRYNAKEDFHYGF